MSELRDYLCSTVNSLKIRKVYINKSDIVYGMSVYDKLIEALKQFKEGITNEVMAFKSLSDMCLHKDYINDRLVYIKSNYEINPQCQNKIDEFKQISDLWHKAKSLNMKYNIADGKMPASFSYNPKFISKFTNILEEAQNKEKDILGVGFVLV